MRPALALAILLLFVSGSSHPQAIAPSGDAVATKTIAGSSAPAQTKRQATPDPLRSGYTSHQPNAPRVSDTSLYKRKGQWQQIVDEFWGPGLPRSQKQLVFDTFADYVHDKFPCFGGLNVRWDSLRALYAQQINDSTSRGGFSALLSKLAGDLREGHVMGWDTIMQSTPLDSGTPIFALSLMSSAAPGAMNYGDVRHFGAVLTPLPDSSLLVLRAVANHPLSLQPGDIILGYEGVPWKRLVYELLQSPLPRRGSLASTESSRMHMLLTAAGLNWHLFDTIDIIRYPSGNLEHLPTSPLSSLDLTEYLSNNEQLPVSSVPQPDYEPVPGANPVSFGIVGGTNIGYIYIAGHGYGAKDAFRKAVAALMETDGLIIDIRFDGGGFVSEGPEAGLALLMNHSTQTLIGLERSSPADLYALKPLDPSWLQAFSFEADPNTLYDRPIAVLVGPFAVSQGDFTAYKFRYLPGARFFGKSVNGAVTGFVDPEPVVGGFFFMVPFFVLADHRDPNTLLVRKEFPVDEPVWLDKDDVALGDDTVVKRALGWITSVAHAHDVEAARRWLTASADTLRLTAVVENPNAHPLTVIAVFGDTTAVDSSAFADDGMHGDGVPGDGLWGLEWVPPVGERFWNVRVTTRDQVDATVFSMPYSARFTTSGPMVIDSMNLSVGTVVPGTQAILSLKLANRGQERLIPKVRALLESVDTLCMVGKSWRDFGDVAAGSPSSVWGSWIFRVLPTCPEGHSVRMLLSVSSDGYTYWADTASVYVGTTGVEEPHPEVLPVTFCLEQNYPNPFNPATTIRYGLPRRAQVRLSVFNTLGQKLATLVEGEEEAGYHEVSFDAGNLPSGMCFYRLEAAGFAQVRTMVIVK